jgi:hypothetical protein
LLNRRPARVASSTAAAHANAEAQATRPPPAALKRLDR